MQYQSLPLFQDDQKDKSIETIPVDRLSTSEFNPRTTRPDDYVERLAQRIDRNGFEITRALWAYPEGDGYKVFAGGTRLQAAIIAGLSEVPVVVHKGFTQEEIVGLADEDNENDEYHEPVSLVDTWMSYKVLADAGWTQERIAQAKGVTRGYVSQILSYAGFPTSVLDQFVTIDLLSGGHARELDKLLQSNNLDPWLDRESAMLHVIEVVTGHSSFTAKNFRTEVGKINAAIECAEVFIAEHEKLKGDFLKRLAESEARTKYRVRQVVDEVKVEIAQEKRRQEQEAIQAANDAEQERLQAEADERRIKEREEWINANVALHLGDFREVDVEPDSVDLIFTDPPYDGESIGLYTDLAAWAAKVLKPGGSLLAYTGHYALPEIATAMSEHLRYWWLIALEHSGNNARLPGKWVFVEWKPILWFVKEQRCSKTFVADLYKSKPPDKALHDWQQDISEAKYYIEQLSEIDGLIADPLAGSGTTLIAGLDANRRVLGCEIDKGHFSTIQERIDDFYQSRQ